MWTRQFSKNSHLSQISFYASIRWFFGQFKEWIFRKTAMDFFFAAFTGHMAYVKSHMITLRCTNNLQETLHTLPLSSMRGFPCY